MNILELLSPAAPTLSGSTIVKMSEHGVQLSRRQLEQISAAQNHALAETERVQFAAGAIADLVSACANSPFLQQGEAGESLATLTETFYAVRDDVPIDVPDEEIIAAIRTAFDAAEGDADALDEPEIARALTTGEIVRNEPSNWDDAAESTTNAYTITDDEGRTYRWNPADWEYDELAPGWDGERWEDDHE